MRQEEYWPKENDGEEERKGDVFERLPFGRGEKKKLRERNRPSAFRNFGPPKLQYQGLTEGKQPPGVVGGNT